MSALEKPAVPAERRANLALAALLVAAAAQRGWNAWALPPLAGYDEPGHAGYMLSLLLEGHLPHPLQGWATFHPPLHYLLGAALWKTLSPLGPQVLIAGLRTPGSLAGLAASGITFHIARRLGASPRSALLAAALVLFVPCAVMAASMIGNEALAAGLAALALPFILALQEDPRRSRAALLAGLFAGLALATKYTGLFVAAACALPFLRRDLDRAGRRSLALLSLAIALVAGPLYARNVALTGSPIPMTRALEPVARAERSLATRPRGLPAYLSFPADAIRRPSLYHVAGAAPDNRRLNGAMTSVWGLTHASIWYDPFATRIPLRFHRDGVIAGPLLATLGLVPALVMLLGFLDALGRLVATRGRAPDAPLAVMALVALVMFLVFTARAPTLTAVKGSYLLPLAPVAGLFFARALDRLPAALRGAVTALSAAAVLASIAVFTCDVVFPGAILGPGGVAEWKGYAAALPGSHIDDVLTWLLGVP